MTVLTSVASVEGVMLTTIASEIRFQALMISLAVTSLSTISSEK